MEAINSVLRELLEKTTYVSLLTFLFGLLLGNWMALWRERRKEFNEVASRIRVNLQSRLSDLRPYYTSIDAVDMELFKHLLPQWKKWRFAKTWSDYEAKCEKIRQDSVGQAFYSDPQDVAEALRRAISYTSLR